MDDPLDSHAFSTQDGWPNIQHDLWPASVEGHPLGC